MELESYSVKIRSKKKIFALKNHEEIERQNKKYLRG